MSSLLPGDRVSLAAKKGKNQNKGVLAVKNEDYYIVVLDEPLVWRESSTWERSHAEDLGVDPRQCIFVPRKEGRRIQVQAFSWTCRSLSKSHVVLPSVCGSATMRNQMRCSCVPSAAAQCGAAISFSSVSHIKLAGTTLSHKTLIQVCCRR